MAQTAGVTTPGWVLHLRFSATSGRYLEIVAHGGGGPGHGSWVAFGAGTPRIDWIDPGVNPPGPGRGARPPRVIERVPVRRKWPQS